MIFGKDRCLCTIRDIALRAHLAAVAPSRTKACTLTSFHDFGLAEPITRALAEEKYATPTPIQAQMTKGLRDQRQYKSWHGCNGCCRTSRSCRATA
jgi:hypothetical protein